MTKNSKRGKIQKLTRTKEFQMDHLVFVYGSLKRGHSNNPLLSGATYIKTSTTKQSNFHMVSFGAFPGVVDSPSGGYFIEGEVYEVNDSILRRLDILESNGSFYTRRLVDIDGMDEPCWMYILNRRGYDGLDHHCPFIRKSEDFVLSWNKTRFVESA